MRIWIFTLVCILFLTGCAKIQTGRNNEPSAIIIRNSTGIYIEEVLIRGIAKQDQYVRVGAISPVPAGVSQIIGRSANPPELPGQMEVCWVPVSENQMCRQKDITAVLKGSTDQENALVFEIVRGSEVRVYLERGQ